MPIVRLPNGELRDEIRQPLYDTIDIDDTVVLPTTFNFFSTVQGKTKVRSNLRQNSQLETAVSFRIQGLALDAQNFRLGNQFVIPQILERSSLELTVGEKIYWTGTGRLASGRMYEDAALDSQAAPAAVLLQQYGWAAVQPVILMGRHVIDVNPLQNFSCLFTIGDMTATELAAATPTIQDVNVSFVFSLKGLLRRPVQ